MTNIPSKEKHHLEELIIIHGGIIIKELDTQLLHEISHLIIPHDFHSIPIQISMTSVSSSIPVLTPVPILTPVSMKSAKYELIMKYNKDVISNNRKDKCIKIVHSNWILKCIQNNSKLYLYIYNIWDI